MTKGEDTRRSILDQALALASTEGLEGLSIGTLADAVGMSKSGLFSHFQSKQELQLAVLRHASDRFVATVIAPALKKPRGEPRLRALFEGWLRWEREEFPGGCVFEAAAQEFDDHPGPVRDCLLETQRDWFETITTVARAGVASGAFKPELDPRAFAFEFSNVFSGFRRHARLLRDPDAEALARAAFDELIKKTLRT